MNVGKIQFFSTSIFLIVFKYYLRKYYVKFVLDVWKVIFGHKLQFYLN